MERPSIAGWPQAATSRWGTSCCLSVRAIVVVGDELFKDPRGSAKPFRVDKHGAPKLIDWVAGTIMPCCVRG